MEHESTKLYGEAAAILGKIFDKCESMGGGWDDLLNHLAAINDHFDTEKEFYHYYFKFIMHVYWRILPWKEPQAFNQISVRDVPIKQGNKTKYVSGFSVWNYDYKMYRWALNKGLWDWMSPSSFTVPEEVLTPAELQRFKKKAGL